MTQEHSSEFLLIIFIEQVLVQEHSSEFLLIILIEQVLVLLML